MGTNPRVAVVHDWLVTYAGSERVLEQILGLYPDADLFAVCDFLQADARAFLHGRPVHTTFIQGLPGARAHFRKYLPLMPLAIEQLDLSGYDLILSSNHAVAKGVITGPDQVHISYVHSPMRYAWDLQHQYIETFKFAGLTGKLREWALRVTLHYLRQWDARAANGVDHFVANSQYIARRILKTYRRRAEVIYPPVAIENFRSELVETAEYYVAASRMVPYKRMDVIVEAFTRMPGKKLVVIGEGSEMLHIRKAAGSNVIFLGHVPFSELKLHLAKARALVFAAEEDFGILPVEAMASGTPVIAFGRGGATETVVGLHHPEPCGVFFGEQTSDAIIKALQEFESADERGAFVRHAIRARAERFSNQAFRVAFSEYVERMVTDGGPGALAAGEGKHC